MSIIGNQRRCKSLLFLVIVNMILPIKVFAANNDEYIQRKIAELEQALASLKNEVSKSSSSLDKDKIVQPLLPPMLLAENEVTESPLLNKSDSSTHQQNIDSPSTHDKSNHTTTSTTSTTALTNKEGSKAPPTNKNNLTPISNKENLTTPPNTSLTSQKPNATSSVNIPLSWLGPDVRGLIVGSASAGFSRLQETNGSFDIVDFNPIFLVSYQDFLLLRASVDFSLDDFGNTDVSLDAMNLNLFVNDHLVFEVGKMDSGLGKFVQDLSPAWINRLPDSPVGFNGDEAAPQSEIGIQIQGGFHFFNSDTMKANYILFLENGPVGFLDTTNGFIDHINTDGTLDNHGNYVVGGRLGFLPIPKFEVGVSAATGKVALVDIDTIMELERKRNYHVLGADISYKPGNWDFRGEYIQQQVSDDNDELFPEGGKWKAWYLQAAYWIPNTKLEPVIRYGKYFGSDESEDQRQWAFGFSYWFTPRIALQAAYELNEGHDDTDNDRNLFLIQLVFGF